MEKYSKKYSTQNSNLARFIDNLINVFFFIGLNYKKSSSFGLLKNIRNIIYLLCVCLFVLYNSSMLSMNTLIVIEYIFLLIVIPIKGVDLKLVFAKISDLDIILKTPSNRFRLMKAGFFISCVGSWMLRLLIDVNFNIPFTRFLTYIISLSYMFVLDTYRVWRVVYHY